MPRARGEPGRGHGSGSVPHAAQGQAKGCSVNRGGSMSMTQVVTDAVKAFRRDVPDCVAAGVVDMSTEMLLAVDTTDAHPGEVLDLLGAATLDLFQGRNVVMIEDAFKQHRGV